MGYHEAGVPHRNMSLIYDARRITRLYVRAVFVCDDAADFRERPLLD